MHGSVLYMNRSDEHRICLNSGNGNSVGHSCPVCSLSSEVQLNSLQPYKWYHTASCRLSGKLIERICLT